MEVLEEGGARLPGWVWTGKCTNPARNAGRLRQKRDRKEGMMKRGGGGRRRKGRGLGKWGMV
jgi:hypothetical protein